MKPFFKKKERFSKIKKSSQKNISLNNLITTQHRVFLNENLIRNNKYGLPFLFSDFSNFDLKKFIIESSYRPYGDF